MEWPDGRSYLGDFQHDQRHGNGLYTFVDGSSYNGEFRDNRYHGTGTFTSAAGQEMRGVWNEGLMIKREDGGASVAQENRQSQMRQLSSAFSWHHN